MTIQPKAGASRIVLVVHYFPPHVGGMEVVARQQAESLAARGHHVTVLTGKHQRGLPTHELAPAGYLIERTGSLNLLEHHFGVTFPLMSPRFILVAARAVARADVVHLHDVFYPTSHAAATVAALFRRPLFVTQHVGLVDYPSRLVTAVQAFIYRHVGRRIYHSAQRVAVYNTNVRDFLVELGIAPAKVVLQHNGIDVKRFRPAERHERDDIRLRYHLPLDRPIVLFVGRLVPKKGFQLVHGARGPSHFTLIVGNGARPAGVGDDPNVRFFGPADQVVVADLYRASDLFVFPAIGEIFTLAMQEAMASGLPVLTYDDPGYQEYDLDRSLIRFVDRSQEDITAAIAHLLGDEHLRTAMSRYSSALASDRFSWDKNYDGEYAMYDGCLPTGARLADLAVVAPFFPPHVGGVEQVAETLAMRAANRRRVTVLTAASRGPSPREDDHPVGMSVHRLRSWVLAKIPIMPALPLRVLLLNPQTIVHVHVAQAFVPELAALAARVRHFPLVVHFHLDIEPSGPMGTIFRLYKRIVLPRLLRSATRVIVLSDEQQRFVSEQYGVPGTRITVIPNGVDDRFREADSRTPHSGPLRVLFVGRLSPQKNVPRLIQAVDRVSSAIDLKVVGEGESRREIEALVAELKLTNVQLVGAAHGADLVEWYRWADILVVSSDREGMPLVVLEAMAAGLPVVATDVSGLRETVAEDGLLVEPDPAALAKAIDQLASDPTLRDQLAERSRRRAERYSWTRIDAELDALYQEISS